MVQVFKQHSLHSTLITAQNAKEDIIKYMNRKIKTGIELRQNMNNKPYRYMCGMLMMENELSTVQISQRYKH